jgi:uncharacterized protein (TIGR00251 family)
MCWHKFQRTNGTKPVSAVTAWNAQVRVIQVKAKPSSRESAVEELEDGSFLVKLRAQPLDGKANAELIALLAKHFKVSRASVKVKSGAGARTKLVSIEHP